MSGLKSLDHIYQPDIRNTYFTLFDPKTGVHRPMQLEDFHGAVDKIKLNENAPEPIVREFNKARNLFVYSWFVYEFGMSAILQSRAVLELAIREKVGSVGKNTKRRSGLKSLLKQIVKAGWIRDGDFPHVFDQRERDWQLSQWMPGIQPMEPPDPNGTEYCNQLIDSLPYIRNVLAHGSSTLVEPAQALIDLEITAVIINKLFPKQ